MREAIKIFYDGTRRIVLASTQSEDDKQYDFRCPVCGRRAFLNISRMPNRENWFSSNEHTPECPLAEGGRVFRTPDGQEFHIGDAMRHVDRPINIPPLQQDAPTRGPEHEDEPEYDLGPDNATLFVPERLHTCSTIYRAASELREDDYLKEDVKVRDFLVDYRTIEMARNEGLEGIKMLVLRRCNPRMMDPAITVARDYVLLRDPYTIDDRNAIYVQVKFAEDTHDKQFRDRLFGDKKRGIEPDPRRYIVAMGRVVRIEDPNYIIYRLSPVSSARLCFIRDIRR